MIRTDRPGFKSKQVAQGRDNVFLNNVGNATENSANGSPALGRSIRDEYCKGRNEIHFHTFACIHVDTPIAGNFCLLLKAAVNGPFKKFLPNVRGEWPRSCLRERQAL